MMPKNAQSTFKLHWCMVDENARIKHSNVLIISFAQIKRSFERVNHRLKKKKKSVNSMEMKSH